MASLWYGHFDSTEDDERYLLAEDLARHIRGFVTDGIRSGGTCLQVTAGGGLELKIDAGTANIQGYAVDISEDNDGRYYPVIIEQGHPSLPRVDRVVLRLDRTIAERRITPIAIPGAAADNPVPPALTRNGNVWELSLARVRINAGALTLEAGNITDERFDTGLCGVMNSVLGLDPSVWQAQFDAFMTELQALENDFLDTHSEQFDERLAELADEFGAQLAAQEADRTAQNTAFAAWFASAQADLPSYAGFDGFDNLWLLPGATHGTVFEADGSVAETLKTTAGGLNIAARDTVFNADGSVTETQTVYAADNTTVLWTRTKTTSFDSDGNITEEVMS